MSSLGQSIGGRSARLCWGYTHSLFIQNIHSAEEFSAALTVDRSDSFANFALKEQYVLW